MSIEKTMIAMPISGHWLELYQADALDNIESAINNAVRLQLTARTIGLAVREALQNRHAVPRGVTIYAAHKVPRTSYLAVSELIRGINDRRIVVEHAGDGVERDRPTPGYTLQVPAGEPPANTNPFQEGYNMTDEQKQTQESETASGADNSGSLATLVIAYDYEQPGHPIDMGLDIDPNYVFAAECTVERAEVCKASVNDFLAAHASLSTSETIADKVRVRIAYGGQVWRDGLVFFPDSQRVGTFQNFAQNAVLHASGRDGEANATTPEELREHGETPQGDQSEK